jgi:glycerate kinase
MHVLLAPDKFKGSLRASEVAAAVAAGLHEAAPGVSTVAVPVADGGDGTLDAAVAAGYRLVPVRVTGPTGESVDTRFAVRDGVAVVELADADAMNLNTGPSGHPAAEVPGAGAAGGVGFAALAVLHAEARPGIDLLLELTGFHGQLSGARLVITGEGSLDSQTLHGKAPAGVAAAARRAGVPVVAVAGRNLLSPTELRDAGVSAAYALLDIEPDPAVCMTDSARLLHTLASRIAGDWLT